MERENEFGGKIKLCSVTQRQLAEAFGVTAARINQLIDENIVVRDETSRAGRVMLFESLENYFLSKKTTNDGTNFWRERTLHEKAKRQLSELKYRERCGELYEAAGVEQVLAEILTDFRNKLMGVGHKLAMRLEGQAAGYISAIIDAEIDEILKELSENVKQEHFTKKATETADTARAVDGERMGG